MRQIEIPCILHIFLLFLIFNIDSRLLRSLDHEYDYVLATHLATRQNIRRNVIVQASDVIWRSYIRVVSVWILEFLRTSGVASGERVAYLPVLVVHLEPNTVLSAPLIHGMQVLLLFRQSY